MESYETIRYNDKEIVLKHKEDLPKLYEDINQDRDFILSYGKTSEVIIASNMEAKVKNAEIILTAEEGCK